MKETIKNVIKNYKKLPKAKDDDGEFVIIAEKDEGGSYEEYKECLGIKEDGTLIWSFLSGCSCGGNNCREEGGEVTVKTFEVGLENNYETVEDFFNQNKCDAYEASYESY